MSDEFKNYSSGLDSPAAHAIAITPSDEDNLTKSIRAFYVGGDGDVKIDTVGGETVTLVGCVVGSYHPIRVKKIYATGTSATNLIGLY